MKWKAAASNYLSQQVASDLLVYATSTQDVLAQRRCLPLSCQRLKSNRPRVLPKGALPSVSAWRTHAMVAEKTEWAERAVGGSKTRTRIRLGRNTFFPVSTLRRAQAVSCWGLWLDTGCVASTHSALTAAQTWLLLGSLPTPVILRLHMAVTTVLYLTGRTTKHFPRGNSDKNHIVYCSIFELLNKPLFQNDHKPCFFFFPQIHWVSERTILESISDINYCLSMPKMF